MCSPDGRVEWLTVWLRVQRVPTLAKMATTNHRRINVNVKQVNASVSALYTQETSALVLSIPVL